MSITNVSFSCFFTPYRNLNLYTLQHLTLCQPTELGQLMAPLRRWAVEVGSWEEEVALSGNQCPEQFLIERCVSRSLGSKGELGKVRRGTASHVPLSWVQQ